MNLKNILIGVVVIVIAVAGYFLLVKQQGSTTQKVQITNNNSLSLTQKDQQELKTIAFDVVNQKTKGEWDRELEIRSVDQSQNAVEGKWVAKDKWDWIAWREVGGKWNVLVSLDGFDCKELESIPSQYNNFFRDLMYRQSGEKYCYSHTSRKNP